MPPRMHRGQQRQHELKEIAAAQKRVQEAPTALTPLDPTLKPALGVHRRKLRDTELKRRQRSPGKRARRRRLGRKRKRLQRRRGAHSPR